MSHTIFQEHPLRKESFLQKLFKQKTVDNAVIELNNLLATKQLNDISLVDVVGIEQRYELSLQKEYSLNLEEFYAVYLNYCLRKKALTTSESNELKQLQQILMLTDKQVTFLHSKVGGIIYKKALDEALSDGRLTDSEKQHLDNMVTNLELPRDVAEKLSSDARMKVIEEYVKQIIADERFSPDEERKLDEMARNLGVSLKLNEQTKRQLEQLKLYWALENLPLPVIQANIVLQKSEVCHLQLYNVSWNELRTITTRVSYGGVSTSIRIAKGIYLRGGSYAPKRHTRDQMTLIDRGTLYLTNKRIIFVGSKKNSNIQFNKIIDVVPYHNGVEIGKSTGKSPLLEIPAKADVFCIMLGRLLNQ